MTITDTINGAIGGVRNGGVISSIFSGVKTFIATIRDFIIGVSPQYADLSLLIIAFIAGFYIGKTQRNLWWLFAVLIFLILKYV